MANRHPRASRSGRKGALNEMNREMESLRKAIEEGETRPERVYRLRIEGYSPRQIADQLGAVGVPMTVQEVEETILGMAERSRSRIAAEMAIATVMEIDRMDAMTKALWPAAS